MGNLHFEESEKVDLKLTFKKLRSWHPVPSLHGKQMWTEFIFLGSKIIADGDFSHEIKDACSLEEKLQQT